MRNSRQDFRSCWTSYRRKPSDIVLGRWSGGGVSGFMAVRDNGDTGLDLGNAAMESCAMAVYGGEDGRRIGERDNVLDNPAMSCCTNARTGENQCENRREQARTVLGSTLI
jgi:hypothetical protein